MPLKNKQTEKQQQQKKNPINLEFHQNRNKQTNKNLELHQNRNKQTNKKGSVHFLDCAYGFRVCVYAKMSNCLLKYMQSIIL